MTRGSKRKKELMEDTPEYANGPLQISKQAHKKQKRAEYRAAQAVATQNEGGPSFADLPRKKFYRQRAHANPFSDHALTYPVSPAHMDWSTHFPAFVADDANQSLSEDALGSLPPRLKRSVEVADIGCGFGGLLFALAPLYPEVLMLGMEIRLSVAEFVVDKIQALRHHHDSQNSTKPTESGTQHPAPSASTDQDPQLEDEPSAAVDPSSPQVPGSFHNISALRANSMKFLPNFFFRSQLRKIFLCFPDPHFKQRKHKARIVSKTLAAEYAYVLRPGGVLYTITDVEDLHEWMCRCLDGCPTFGRVDEAVYGSEQSGSTCDGGNRGGTDGDQSGARVRLEDLEVQEREEIATDVRIMRSETEEGKKVTRNQGLKFVACWRRLADPPWPGEGESTSTDGDEDEDDWVVET